MPCNLHRWMSEMRISIQTLALELPWYLFLPSLGASILKLVRGDMISWRDPMGPVSLTREESSLQLSKCSLLGPHWTVFILSKVSAERPLTLGNSHSLLPEKPTVFTSDYFMSWESYEINDCNVYIIIFFYTSTWFQSQVPILPVEKNYLSQFRLILVTGSLVNSGIYFPPLFFSGLDLNFGGVGSREQLIDHRKKLWKITESYFKILACDFIEWWRLKSLHICTQGQEKMWKTTGWILLVEIVI